MTIRTTDIVPGARLVVGRRLYCFSRDLSKTVEELDVVFVDEDEQGLFFINRGGKRRDIEPNRDPYSSAKLRIPSEVVWTMPVPEATDEELRRLAMGAVGISGSSSNDRPLLLHVQSVQGDLAYALPVIPKGNERNVGSIFPRDDGRPDYVVGNACIWAHMLRIERQEDDWALRAGALLVAWTGKAKIVDGLPVHTVRHMIDVLTCTVERLGSWLPDTLSPNGYYTGPFDDIHEIEEEETRARVRLEPNEALVLGYLDGDTRGGMMLGTSGITFHHADDPMSSMFGADDPELGLWVAQDATWTGEGEDVQIESDMRPATMADVERFGWDAENIRTEIAGDQDVSLDRVPEDICEQVIAQAAEVDALQTWENDIHDAWRRKADTLSEGLRPSHMTHMMRYPIQDFISMARSRLCAIDGLDMTVAEDRITLAWPGASIVALADGTLVVTLPAGVQTYARNSNVDRQEIFQPLVDWLSSRPEHTERTRPHDPRTVVLVRAEA